MIYVRSELVEANDFPSGLNVTAHASAACPLNVFFRLPLLMSQVLIVPSTLAVASRSAFRFTAMPLISLGVSHELTDAPDSTLQVRIVLSRPAETSKAPANATLV